MKLEKAVIYIIMILFISNTIKIVLMCRRIIDKNDYNFFVYICIVYIVKMMYIRFIVKNNVKIFTTLIKKHFI